MEDKYIRASKAILDKMGGKYVPLRVLLVAETIKAEIEREEPLVPGVRYRNTEANRKRADEEKFYNVWDQNGSIYIGWVFGGKWQIDVAGLCMEDNTIASFSPIPDGEAQDE
jgi:hypothetical protein